MDIFAKIKIYATEEKKSNTQICNTKQRKYFKLLYSPLLKINVSNFFKDSGFKTIFWIFMAKKSGRLPFVGITFHSTQC
jgi:hypothetical protein